jgi:hypothetical protein
MIAMQAASKTADPGEETSCRGREEEDPDADDDDAAGDDDEEDDEEVHEENPDVEEKDMFGYIDENGVVVYVEISDENEPDTQEHLGLQPSLELDVEPSSLGTEFISPVAPTEPAPSLVTETGILALEIQASAESRLTETETKGEEEYIPSSDPRRFFEDQIAPCPRINSCLMIRGNTLYIYGGVVEIGDIEVTLDDCWALDLNRRDSWRKVLPGTMHLQVNVYPVVAMAAVHHRVVCTGVERRNRH